MQSTIRLNTLRKEAKVTQVELSNYLGIGVRQYQYYEKGQTDIPSSKLIALADYFDVSIDYLVGRTDDPKRY